MQVAIGLYDGVTALDWIGPYQVLAARPDTEVVLCAAERGTVTDDNGLVRVEVDAAFSEVAAPDILLVPGGLITRKLAVDGHPIVEWARSAHQHTTWTTSVCTGALVLGAAGILDGLTATTHWIAYEWLARYGASPTEQRVVEAGKVITCAGVSAGIDMALHLVARLHSVDRARQVRRYIQYDPRPPV